MCIYIFQLCGGFLFFFFNETKFKLRYVTVPFSTQMLACTGLVHGLLISNSLWLMHMLLTSFSSKSFVIWLLQSVFQHLQIKYLRSSAVGQRCSSGSVQASLIGRRIYPCSANLSCALICFLSHQLGNLCSTISCH